MRIKRLIFKSIFILLSFQFLAWLDPYRDAVTNGNDEYNGRKYNNAGRYYQKAREYAPGDDDHKKISFNEGDAEYMLENYEGAVSSFQNAAQSDDREVQKKAFFNSGNAYLKQEKYQEAVQAYMNALKIDPQYARAKKNIEYLIKKMNDQKGQNKDKDKNKDKNNQKNQPQRNKQHNSGKNQERNAGEKKNDSSKMNKEQIKNILRSMQQKPVQRRKGTADERRKLEKDW